MSISDHYVWFVWASAFLVPWIILYALYASQRRVMWWVSIFTMPFGLTEPLFVPEYWNPPSLFDLAQRTGFDIESLIFCFAIGGIAAVLYNALTGRDLQPIDPGEKRLPMHRHHYLALGSPFIAFLALYFLPWNPIYPGILAMFVGAVAMLLCRPDLKTKTWVGGLLFVLCYIALLQGLRWLSPGYIERVWDLDALLGLQVFHMPIEELLFAAGFGMYWSGVYEHLTWRRVGLRNVPMTPENDLAIDHDCTPALELGCEAGAVLYTEGDELYAAMIDSIASARHEISLESYLFADDEVGRSFADVLCKRATAGVHVRLMIDAEGCRSRMSRRLTRRLADSGVEMRRFRPWRWGSPSQYWRRDHRKLLAVDGEVAYLGGFNIHRESSRAYSGEKRWRDTHVRLGGALARQVAGCFDAFWRRDLQWQPLDSVFPCSILMPNQTRACLRRLRCTYAALFAEAQKTIHIGTPYFVPDHRTQRILIEAAGRGVEVSLLVPGKSDVPITRWAARAAYARLLAAGVKVYEYLPRMFHSKTAVIDGTWATIGTANMDYRSFFLNYELNLITRDEQLCRQLQIQFERDLTESAEIGLHVWGQRKWTEYFFETIGWLSRRWL